MNALPFFEQGVARFEEVVVPGVLCAFDFDGTLAPIVTVPDRAAMPAGVRQRLVELSQLTPTAIITGRSLEDIRERIGFTPTWLIGNHGMQGLPGWEEDAARHAEQCLGWETALQEALRDPCFDPGIKVESKQVSLSIHYRLARDRDAAREQLNTLLPMIAPDARIVAGKCVFNLLPPDAADKGTALESLLRMSGAPGALYIGDDVTDEDVFRRKSPMLLTLRVGVEKTTAAEFFINHRLHIFMLLDALIERLRGMTSAQGLRA